LGKIYEKRPTDYGKALADAWLAWSFGVKPTVNDANDAAAAFNRLNTGLRHDTVPIRARGHERIAVAEYDDGNINLINGQSNSHVVQFTDKNVFIHGALKCGPENTSAILREFGVGVFDIIPAIYEAIPWSFFIDYFANVGENLDAMRLWAADFAFLNTTVRNVGVRNVGSLRPVAFTGYEYQVKGGGYYSATINTSRGASQVPYPGFHFQMPGFPSLKWLNIAALAKQVSGSKK
jgi:hypothetical protein